VATRQHRGGSRAFTRERSPSSRVEASNPDLVVVIAAKLDWGLRQYAGRIACLLPKQSSLEEVLHSLSGAGVLSISLQRVLARACLS
jgi:hypothetical protein